MKSKNAGVILLVVLGCLFLSYAAVRTGRHQRFFPIDAAMISVDRDSFPCGKVLAGIAMAFGIGYLALRWDKRR